MNAREITNDELIKEAEAVINPQKVRGRLFGDVGAALVTDKGNVYKGVCIDTPNWGLCAERSAIAAMVTAKELRIAKIVGVWKNASGETQVLPPCGLCREFMRQVHSDNLEADVILKGTSSSYEICCLTTIGLTMPLRINFNAQSVPLCSRCSRTPWAAILRTIRGRYISLTIRTVNIFDQRPLARLQEILY